MFIDGDTIEPGVDFAEAISRAVAACQVLVVIGPKWLTGTEQRDRRRLDDPDDLVRLEIEAALARDVRVIPILVGDAVMPGRDDLPESLAGLARRNALLIRHESFHSDAGRLVTTIERVLAAPGTTAVPNAPGARSAGMLWARWRSRGLNLPETISPGLPGSSLTPKAPLTPSLTNTRRDWRCAASLRRWQPPTPTAPNASPAPSPTSPRRHGRCAISLRR